MGKPFNSELTNLRRTIEWVDAQKTENLRTFLCNSPQTPLACIGSGGSFSACHYASLLYRENCGIAYPVTPLELQSTNPQIIANSKLLYISASGHNKDIQQAFKLGIYNEVNSASLCTTEINPLNEIAKNCDNHTFCHYAIPTKKDGFLATNSLLAFFGLLYKAYYSDKKLSELLDINDENNYTIKPHVDLANIQNFIVLYGHFGEPVAYDIESKLSEAALGATLLSDYRNFGHGRHHWFDKCHENSCIIAIITEEDKDLAEKTIDNLPNNIPVIYIRSNNYTTIATIDMLIKAFYFVRDLGKIRNIDPGKPGVPDYGSKLYKLSYAKLIKKVREKESISDLAILRKSHLPSLTVADENVKSFYRKKYEQFIDRLNSTNFEMIAFDYDGTLSGNSHDARHATELADKIKEQFTTLLQHGIKIAVISGRGTSIVNILNHSIPKEYESQVFVGHYNGMKIYPLNNPTSLDNIKNASLHNELEILLNQLYNICPFFEKGEDKIEKRQYQLTLKHQRFAKEVIECCREIIQIKELQQVNVWQSSHSMDIVISGIVDKRNIIKYFTGNILCIGDSGAVGGNDFQLLSMPYSLSANRVSYNPDTCWNIAPADCRNVDATLYYLRKLKLNNGTFKCKFEK